MWAVRRLGTNSLTKSDDQFVDEWQDAVALWEELQARRTDVQANLASPNLASADREHFRNLLAELSEHLAQAKMRMDAIIQRARESRSGRTGDFVVAEMGPDLVSDQSQKSDDMPVRTRAHR